MNTHVALHEWGRYLSSRWISFFAVLGSMMWFSLYAQGQTTRERLEATLPRTTGMERATVLADLAAFHYRSDPLRALAYADEALGLLPANAANTDADLVRRTYFWMGRAAEHFESSDSMEAITQQLRRWAEQRSDAVALADADFLDARRVRLWTGAEQARPLFEDVLARYRQLGAEAGQAHTLLELGALENAVDAYPEARAYLKQAVELFEKQGDDAGRAHALQLLGDIARYEGELGQALQYYERVLALETKRGHDEGLARVYKTLGDVYRSQQQFALALASFQEAFALAEARGEIARIGRLYHNLGMTHEDMGTYDQAMEHFQASLRVDEQLGNTEGVAISHRMLGRLASLQGDHETASHWFAQAADYFKAVDDGAGLALVHYEIGKSYSRRALYDSALVAYTRTAEIEQAYGLNDDYAATLNVIGNLYDTINRYDDALAFYQRALAIWTAEENRVGISYASHNIGTILDIRGQHEEALVHYERSLAIDIEIGDIEDIAISLETIGSLYSELERYEEAERYFRQSLALARETGDHRRFGVGHLFMGELYAEQGRLQEALDELDLSRAYYDSINVPARMEQVELTRSEVLERMGRYAEALEAYKAHKAASDSIYAVSNKSVFAEVEQQYRTREQAQQIDLLNQRQQIQRLWLGGLGGGALLVILIAGLVYFRYRDKNKAHAALTRAHTTLQTTHQELKSTQARLVQQEKMASLGQLTAGIAHEIKNPLNFINNFAELNAELAQELREALVDGLDPADILADLEQNATIIAQHGKRADQIVKSMMAHARTGEGTKTPVNLNTLIDEHVKLAYHGKRALVPGFNAEITATYGLDVGTVEVAPQDIGRVILNIVGNAFDAILEARVPEPRVTVSTHRVADLVEIRIADNGPGMPEEVQAKVFEPFFTTKPTGQGTGLGLSMSYDIVTLGHGGTMTVESEVGQGATFVIMLPDVR